MTKKSFTTSTKCEQFSNFVKNLTAAQRASVRACGFSSLLHFDCSELPRSVAYMLGCRFHVPTRTVWMEGGCSFELNAFVAHQVLGVPLGGWKIKEHASREEIATVLGDTGTAVAPTINELFALVSPELNGDKFVRVFMLISLSALLCPTGYPRASKRYYSAVASIGDIGKYDWCSFIVDWLVEGIQDFQNSVAEKYQMPTFCGCIILLVFAFFEYVKAPGIILREDWPRIKVWNDRMVNEYLDLEGMSDDDSFGDIELKHVSETPFVVAGSLSSAIFARLPAQVESFIENMAPHDDLNLAGHNNQANARSQIRDMCSKFHRDIMAASISAIQPVVSSQLCSMAEFMWTNRGGAGTSAPRANDAPGPSVPTNNNGGDGTPVQVQRDFALGVTTRSRSKEREATPVYVGLRTRSRSRLRGSSEMEVEDSGRMNPFANNNAINTTQGGFMSSATRKGKAKLDGGMPSTTRKSRSEQEVVDDSPQNVVHEKLKNKDSASKPEIVLQPNEADPSQEGNEVLLSSQDTSFGPRHRFHEPSVAEVDTGQVDGRPSTFASTPSVVLDSLEGEVPPSSSQKKKVYVGSSTPQEVDSGFVSNINMDAGNQRIILEGLDNSKNLSHQNAVDNVLHPVPQSSVSIPDRGNAKVVTGGNKNLVGREVHVVEPSVSKTGVNDGRRSFVENVLGYDQRVQHGTNSGDVPIHTDSASNGSINCAQPNSYSTPIFPTIPTIGNEVSRFQYTSNLKSHAKGDNQLSCGPDTRKRLLDSVVPDPFEGVGRPVDSSKRKAAAISKTSKVVVTASGSDSNKARKKQRLSVTESSDHTVLDQTSRRMPSNLESGQKSPGLKQKDNVNPDIAESASVKCIPAHGERKSSEQFARKRAQKPSVHLGTQDLFFNHPQEKIQLSASENKLYDLATRRVSKRKQQESNIVANIGRFYTTEDKFVESFKARGWVGNFEMDVFCEAMNLEYSSYCEPKKLIPKKFNPSKCFLSTDIVAKLRVTKQFKVSAVKEYIKKTLEFSMDNYDMVMIPVLQVDHWWLIVVDLRDHRFDFLNSCEMSPTHLKISIQICNNFRLLYESMYSKPKLDDFKNHPQPAPQQKNNYDCGIFVMKFMALWCGRKLSPMSNKNIIEYRKQIVNYILRHPENKETTAAIKQAIRCRS